MTPSQRRPAAFAGTSVGAAAGRCSGRGPRQDHDAAHSAIGRRPAVIRVLVVAPTGARGDSLAPLLAADAQLDVAAAVADLASAVSSATHVHSDAVVDDSIGDGTSPRRSTRFERPPRAPQSSCSPAQPWSPPPARSRPVRSATCSEKTDPKSCSPPSARRHGAGLAVAARGRRPAAQSAPAPPAARRVRRRGLSKPHRRR
jgi:hypothetical protein